MLWIGWTTFSKRDDAAKFAQLLVETKRAVCCQLQDEITSWYRWQGKVECDQEFRLMVKFTEEKRSEIRDWVVKHHPYDTPQWVAVKAEEVSESYLNWALSE